MGKHLDGKVALPLENINIHDNIQSQPSLRFGKRSRFQFKVFKRQPMNQKFTNPDSTQDAKPEGAVVFGDESNIQIGSERDV
jgi:hypothetical protein